MTQSNEPTIEIMNGVIAVFMNQPRMHPSDRRWHKDWNCLMQVVEKIEDVQLNDKNNVVTRAAANVQIFYEACLIQYEPDEESGDTNDEVSIQTSGKTKLEAVYKAVYQFITWLNQQKQNP